MITASFVRAIERSAGDLCLHFLPLFQQVVTLRKTCNQLDVRGQNRPVDITRTAPDRSSRISRRAQVHIWTRSPCQGALEWTNALRDRCSHISGLLVKAAHSLRALMKSALPLLITTAASEALYLRRLGGSRSDLSCHQFDHTSHCAEGLLDLSIKSKYCSNTRQRPI
jgi:hypothetical protein